MRNLRCKRRRFGGGDSLPRSRFRGNVRHGSPTSLAIPRAPADERTAGVIGVHFDDDTFLAPRLGFAVAETVRS